LILRNKPVYQSILSDQLKRGAHCTSVVRHDPWLKHFRIINLGHGTS